LLCCKLALDHHLCGDAGVIGTGLPESVVTFHPVVADQGVHDGILKRVAHMQGAGDVRWRNHDAVRRAAAVGCKVIAALPVLVPGLFYGGRVVGGFHGVQLKLIATGIR